MAEHLEAAPRQSLSEARALLDAIAAISSDLDLHAVLTRTVTAATRLTSAEYGALGVIGTDGGFVDLVLPGVDQPCLDLSDGPPWRAGMLVVPIRIRGTVFGNLYLADKVGGQRFTLDDEAVLIGLADAAGLVIENARAYGLNEQRRRWLEASAELTDALVPPIALRAAFQQIAERARATAGALGACIVQVPDDGEPFIAAGDGADAQLLEPALPDIAAVARTLEGQAGLVLDGIRAVVQPLPAHLGAPSALVIVRDAHGHDAVDDGELLQAFADHAGLTLDRAQASNDREKLVLLAERERIARGLHDVVMQRLFASGMQLESLRVTADSPEAAERIDRAIDGIDETIREIRSTIFGLQARRASQDSEV